MRSAILAVVMAVGLGSYAANAQIAWRMATKQPADGPEGKVFQHFADRAAEHSGGKIKVIIFPNEQLGKEAA